MNEIFHNQLFYLRCYNHYLINIIKKKINKKSAWLIVAILAILPSGAIASDLTVEVLGIRSNSGLIHYGLYNKFDTFLKSDGRLNGAREVINNNRSVFVFRGLNPGLYAVAVYHDENLNEEFDKILFGIPAEDYGFSNSAVVFFGPPDFNAAAVLLPPEGLNITIHID